MSHASDQQLAMTDRWIAECRRILAEARERREGRPLRDIGAAQRQASANLRQNLEQPAAAPERTPEPVDTWTPTSVLDDIPPGPEPDEEDWRR